MKKIEKITFKNFKAFYGEETLNIGSKNMLLYGENGSGKSSIFWGLYTFLQSTTKSQDEIKKYFVQFDEADPSTFESLKNVYSLISEDAYIELVTKDETLNNFTTDKISFDNSTTDTSKDNLPISLANASSDFINYKFLHNFYNVTHKQEINLWKVFEHDIFPYFRRTERDRYYIEEIHQLTKDVPRNTSTGRANRVDSWQYSQYNEKIDNLNGRIELFLSEIQTNANEFLRKYFYDDKDKLRLTLRYDNKIQYDKVYYSTHDYSIHLNVEFFNEIENRWISIKRPQSFLNEAQLTRIAIAVRVGALLTRVSSSDYKILCLDDMLISLDMGNREKVIKTFLNTEKRPELNNFNDFQKLIFTHDRGFYNLCKQRIELDLDPKDWVFKEMYFDTEISPPKPYIADNSDDFKKAEKFLKAFDYPASANALRQGLEKVMRNFLPKTSKFRIDKGVTELKDLDGHLKEFEKILNLFGQDKSLINDLFVYKKHIMNPFSHNNIDSPIFKEEIEKVLATIPKLTALKTDTLKEASQAINKFNFQDKDTTGQSHIFEIEFYEDIVKFTLLDNQEYLNKSQCKLLKRISLGISTDINLPFDNLKDCSSHIEGILSKTYTSDSEIISKFRF